MLCALTRFLGSQLHGVLVVKVSITEVNKKSKIKGKTSHGGCLDFFKFCLERVEVVFCLLCWQDSVGHVKGAVTPLDIMLANSNRIVICTS